MEQANDIARQKHLEEMLETKDLMKDCKKDSHHYNDLKRHYVKLRKQLFLYDYKMGYIHGKREQ